MLKILKNTIQDKFFADNRLKEVMDKGAIALLFKLLGVVSFFIFNKAVIYYVNEEAWGTFALFHSILSIMAIVGVIGCDTAMIRFMAEQFALGQKEKAKGIYRQIFKLVILFTLTFSVLLFLAAPFLAGFYNDANLKYVFYIGSLCVFPMTITALHSEGLRGMKKIKQFSYVQQGTQFGLAILIFIFFTSIKAPFSPIAIIAFIIAMWLNAALSISLFYKHSGFKLISSETSGFTNYKLLSWTFPMFLSGFLQIVMSNTDLLILRRYASDFDLGIYRTGLQITGAVGVALFAVNTIVAPKFAELYAKKDMEGLALVVRNTTRFMFLVSLPIMLLILLFPKFILGIFSTNYIIDEAIYALIFLTISQLFNVGFGSVLTLLNMTGRQKVVQNIVIIANLINISLCMIFIPLYGIVGAAIANALNMLTWNIIAALYIKKYYNIWTIAFLQ